LIFSAIILNDPQFQLIDWQLGRCNYMVSFSFKVWA